MTSTTSEFYFQSSAGFWDHLSLNEYPPTLKATVHIPATATAISLAVDIATTLSAVGPLCVDLDTVDLIGPDGTTYNIYTVGYGGCTFPVNCFGSGSYSNISNPKDYTSELSKWAGKDVTIVVHDCEYDPFGTPNVDWSLTAYMIITMPVTPTTVTFNVVGGGQGLDNVPIQITDTTNSLTTTIYTNSSGVATLSGVDIGDDIGIVISFSNAATIKETVSIEEANPTVDVTMTCDTGYTFTNGVCTAFIGSEISSILTPILIGAGVVSGAVVVYELAKGHQEKEATREYVSKATA